jgi:hypothetical protein
VGFCGREGGKCDDCSVYLFDGVTMVIVSAAAGTRGQDVANRTSFRSGSMF